MGGRGSIVLEIQIPKATAVALRASIPLTMLIPIRASMDCKLMES